jgi:hypothetical protein
MIVFFCEHCNVRNDRYIDTVQGEVIGIIFLPEVKLQNAHREF